MKTPSPFWKSIGILLFCCSIPAAAQSQAAAPPGESPAPSLAGADRRIALDMVVTDKSGKPISGLRQQDFTVLDNKLPQKLVSFRAVDQTTPGPPPEVILVVDAVNTSFITVSYERSEIVRFLGQNGGKLAQPVSIIFFKDTNTEMQRAPSRDGNALIAEFDKYVTGLRTINRSAGFYGAQDRLNLSLRAIGGLAAYEATKPGRKLVIWISPGWPLLSGPRIQLTGRQEEGVFGSVVALSAGLRKAGITLYSIDPLGAADAGSLRSFYYENFLKGVTKPNNVVFGNLGLQVLAVQSGGLALRSSNDITAEIDRCAADASAYYEVSFDSPPAEHPNEYHGLQVNVDKPGLTVRTHTAYYAQP
jgi:VWFA-related protein